LFVLNCSTYDTIFYADGSIENKATASGYLQSTFYDEDLGIDDSVGVKIRNYTVGSLHDHMWSYKVDLDIYGTQNSLHRHDYKTRLFNYSMPIPQGPTLIKTREMTHVMTEQQGLSSMVHDTRHPTCFAIENSNALNAWGTPRGYKVHIVTSTTQLLNDSAIWMPSAQWTKYNVVVTARKENITEDRVGYGFFDQTHAAEPVKRFDDWAFDGDSIDNTDLVAWVTIGSVHMPVVEDIPITYSIGTSSSFLLKPMNYYDESPLMDLYSNVYVAGDGSVSETNVNVQAGQECYVPAKGFEFRGGSSDAPTE
jgi:Cu2+-containing amine oxidase